MLRSNLIIIICCIYVSAFSQNRNLDSLKAAANVNTEDTLQAKSLIRAGYALSAAGHNKDAQMYLEKALTLSEKLNYKKGTSNAYSVMGTVAMYTGDYKEALEKYRKAEVLFEQINDRKGKGIVWNNMGIVCDRLGDFDASIKYYEKSIQIKKEIKDFEGVSTAYSNLANLYIEKGEILKGIDFHFKSLEIEKMIGNVRGQGKSLESIGIIYNQLKQTEKAKEYYSQAEKIYEELEDEPALTNLYVNIGNVYYDEKKLEKAQEYFDDVIAMANKIGDSRMIGVGYSSIGLILSEKKDYNKSLEFFRKSLNYSITNGEQRGVLSQYLNLSKTFNKMGLKDSALYYGKKSNEIALAVGLVELTVNTEKNLSEIYEASGDLKNALLHYKNYKLFSDSMVTVQKQGQMAELFVKYETRITDSENEKLKQQNRISELTIKNNRFVFITVCLTLGFFICVFAVVYFRNKYKYQKEKAELEQKTLRLQMNPHFIFNAINSIQRYILQKDKHEAYTYLTKFSQLMRDVLNTANDKNVTLTKELEMLKLYVELEQLRFEDSFDFILNTDEEIDTDNIYLPGLLIQPFIENAIWHGIMPLENSRKGILKLTLKRENEAILIQIEDNGIGREVSEKIKKSANHKSMGMKLSKQRLELFKNANDVRKATISIEDVTDATGAACGTRVNIYLA